MKENLEFYEPHQSSSKWLKLIDNFKFGSEELFLPGNHKPH